MAYALFTYFLIGFGILAILGGSIMRIGKIMADRPDAIPGSRAAAFAIATGYAAIGAGGVLLAAVLVPLFVEYPLVGLLLASGLVALCLGLGFSQAVANLRGLSRPEPAAPKAKKPKVKAPKPSAEGAVPA